jgi:hypothetical protein
MKRPSSTRSAASKLLGTLLALLTQLSLSSQLALPPRLAVGDEWMAWPSSYTHDPLHGQRVDQYAQPVDPIAPQRADFQRSGFRHYRSTLQAGQSADNLHIVEQWGRPIVPYEQWRFPYRPYGVPYDAWGPQAPYGIINGSFNGFPGYGAYPPTAGYPPGSTPSDPYSGGQQSGSNPYYPTPNLPGWNGSGGAPGFPLTPPYSNQPWYDGTYPSAPPLDNRSDREFFYKPPRQLVSPQD